MSVISKLIFAIVLLIICTCNSELLAQQIAVKGETVYTSDGEPLRNGIVLIKNGKIERVGLQLSIPVPSGYDVYEAKVVTPGFIDAHSVVGFSGIYNVNDDQDQLELSSAIQPDLRAIDAYNAREELVRYLRHLGVTTVHTGHGPGAVISGQTMIVKTHGESVKEALVDSVTALAMTLGSSVRSNFDNPGTRAKAVAMLRQELIKAQEYHRKDPGDRSRNLKMEALGKLLDGEIYGLITAHKSNDIMTALRLQEEFGFKLLLDGASEAYLVIDEIRNAGVPVIIHPSWIRTRGDSENASFETAGKLSEAGITVLFQSGYERYVPKTRVVYFETAIAIANGLDYNAGIRSLTIDAAKVLGIEEKTGSLRRGKDADLVLFNGDPFEYLTHPLAVIIDGQVVYETN